MFTLLKNDIYYRCGRFSALSLLALPYPALPINFYPPTSLLLIYSKRCTGNITKIQNTYSTIKYNDWLVVFVHHLRGYTHLLSN
jgi:hypothetical protein